jgi:hypothetical protein
MLTFWNRGSNHTRFRIHILRGAHMSSPPWPYGVGWETKVNKTDENTGPVFIILKFRRKNKVWQKNVMKNYINTTTVMKNYGEETIWNQAFLPEKWKEENETKEDKKEKNQLILIPPPPRTTSPSSPAHVTPLSRHAPNVVTSRASPTTRTVPLWPPGPVSH